MNKINPKLDNTDLKILFELDKNSRIPVSVLSKKLRVSREIGKYRIKNLVERGIIKNFTTIINPAKFGYIIYKVYLKFQNLSKEKEKQMLNYLLNHKNIFWIGRCEGIFDLIFGVYVNNLVEFDDVLSDFMGNFSQNILSRQISNSVYVDIYRRDYLTNKKSEPVFWGGIPFKESLDDIEKDLLKFIAENSRITIVELSKKLNSTSKKIINRVKQLENKKIILGYRINLNLRKIKKEYFKAIISFQNITPEKEKVFKNYCKQNPNICYYIRTIANWDVELDIEIENFEKFNQLIRDIRDKFGDIVRTTEIIFISEEMKGELNIIQNL